MAVRRVLCNYRLSPMLLMFLVRLDVGHPCAALCVAAPTFLGPTVYSQHLSCYASPMPKSSRLSAHSARCMAESVHPPPPTPRAWTPSPKINSRRLRGALPDAGGRLPRVWCRLPVEGPRQPLTEASARQDRKPLRWETRGCLPADNHNMRWPLERARAAGMQSSLGRLVPKWLEPTWLRTCTQMHGASAILIPVLRA